MQFDCLTQRQMFVFLPLFSPSLHSEIWHAHASFVGGCRARESKNKEARPFLKKELLSHRSVVLFFYINNIKTFKKFSIHPQNRFGPPLYGLAGLMNLTCTFEFASRCNQYKQFARRSCFFMFSLHQLTRSAMDQL